ncbi:type I polyketide synthase, partial [Streptomyces sp. NPDC005047]
HGTGTRLGDPIEAQALLATYGQGRGAERPLWLGSLKSNVGHAQAAAGVGGVIKMVMALEHGVLPRTLHVDEPSSRVDWSAGAVELLAEQREWPEVGRPRRAGVSSFGVSGTNAHVILEQAPAVESVAGPEAVRDLPVVPLVVSAKSQVALEDQSALVTRLLESAGDVRPLDVAFSLATGRSVFEHRQVRVGEVTVEGVASQSSGRTVLVFPGQGTQWAGMGRELLDSSPVFASRLGECAAALEPFVDFDPVEVLRSGAALERVEVIQPVTWAVMVSLAELWRSVGVVPDAVVGHSQGEIAAAAVSGALSLGDAARVVALRAQVIGRELAGLGGMASISLPRTDVEARLAGWEGRLDVAAVNGPSSTVVAGDADAIVEFVAACQADEVRARQVPVDYASHSAHVERIEAELLDVLAPITPRRARIPFYSTVDAAPADTTTLDAGYWYRNLRHTVRFEETVRLLASKGFGTFVESSAHPVLTMGVQETADVVAVGSLRRDDGGLARFLTSAAELFVHGTSVDWAPLFEGTGAHQVDLPTYPFQRQHYWHEPLVSVAAPTAAAESDAWRYRVSWQGLAGDAGGALGGRWLVVVPEGVESAGAEAALAGAGARVERLVVDAGNVERGELAARLAAHGDLTGILSLLSLDRTPAAVFATVALVQAAADTETGARLWAATREAVAVVPGEVAEDVGAQIWAFARVAALELPALWGGVIDLPAEPDDRAWRRLVAALEGRDGEDQIAVRASGTYGRRISRAGTAPVRSPYSPRGTVLVTGGTGALGAQVARWAAREAACALLAGAGPASAHAALTGSDPQQGAVV